MTARLRNPPVADTFSLPGWTASVIYCWRGPQCGPRLAQRQQSPCWSAKGAERMLPVARRRRGDRVRSALGGVRAGAVQPDKISALITEVRDAEVDAALILTSFHQSPLPLAAAPDGRRRLDWCDQRGLPRLAARSAPSNRAAAPRAREKPLPGAGRRFPARRMGPLAVRGRCRMWRPGLGPIRTSSSIRAPPPVPAGPRQNTAECWWPAWWTPAIG